MKVLDRLMTFLNIKQQRKMVVGLMLGGCLLFVTSGGCNSYESNSIITAQQRQHFYDQANASRNPVLLFGSPGSYSNSPSRVSPESFGRYEWPIAQVPQGYASYGETTTYQETVYSNSYMSGDNVPRFHYQRRLRTYKTGSQFRN